MPDRPYVFYELTNSLCHHCLRKVEAKVVIEDGCVYLHKWCPEHRFQKALISSDAEYYKLCRQTLKPSQMPLRFNTPIQYGCPFDCGLCPDHEQHSCLALIEVTDQCNLTCPVCYSESSPRRTTHRSLEQIAFMLDRLVRNEGEPDVVQISGGEPTIHPDFFRILDLAKARPIKHLMVNTNGVRIANDADFARRLKDYTPGFEIYLQFDSLRPGPLVELRGVDLTDVRRRAIDRLNELNLSTTLVVTLKKGLNDGEIGEIIDFALQQPCVRGVTLQPIQSAGRLEDFDPAVDRLTLGEVRQQILRQSSVFRPADIVPVPCHPDCLAMAYALKLNGKVIPITGEVDPQTLLEAEGSTIVYEKNPQLRDKLFTLFTSCGCEPPTAEEIAAAGRPGSGVSLKQLLCCLPQAPLPPSVGYDNLFRLIIMQFLDAYNFDVRSVKKSCVHIVHPDGRVIPFDTFNLFYRDDKVKVLDGLRGTAGVVPMRVGGGML